jgi:hypothetical protein
MKTLFTEEEYNNSKSSDKLLCECLLCQKSFGVTKSLITYELKHNRNRHIYCSDECYYLSRKTSSLNNTPCSNCGVSFERKPSEIDKSKSGNIFCSQSCSATFNNKTKTHGNRRSKLEIWLEDEITKLYPNLQIDFNKKDTIGSELDIFIPSLNIAFELNGIFHYEPIYGVNKLNQIQENDKSKTKICHELKIDLCIIDVSQQKYFTLSTSQKYLDIITNIINERLSISQPALPVSNNHPVEVD